jgi:hypothetical protein
MINTLQWPTLAESRLKTRLVLFYKIVHCLVAIPSHILVPTSSRTRQNHLQTFRQIQTTKDTYKFSTCSNDVNEQWKIFSSKLNNAIEECIPMKRVKIRGFKAKKHTIPIDKKSLSKIKRKQRL